MSFPPAAYPPPPSSGPQLGPPPGYGYAPPPPQKKSNTGLIAGIVIGLVLLVVVLPLGILATIIFSVQAEANRTHPVVAKFTISGGYERATVTFYQPGGGSEPLTGYSGTGDERRYQAKRYQSGMVSVTASNYSGSPVTVTCEVTVDGVVKESKTDTGSYAHVSCSGSPR